MSIPRHRKTPVAKKRPPEQKIPKSITALDWLKCKKPVLLVARNISPEEIFKAINVLKKLGARRIHVVVSDKREISFLVQSEEFFACFQFNDRGELMLHPGWESYQAEKRKKRKKQHQRKKTDDKIKRITEKGMSALT